MGNTNRVTLEQLDKMTAEEAQVIPQDQLETLLEDAAKFNATSKRYDDKLFAEMDRRFKGAATSVRLALKKDTGTVRVVSEGVTIKCDLPKIVKWDQAEMVKAADTVRGWNSGPVSEYIKITMEVPEGKYQNWPTAIREVFDAARIVSNGKPTYEFVKVAA